MTDDRTQTCSSDSGNVVEKGSSDENITNEGRDGRIIDARAAAMTITARGLALRRRRNRAAPTTVSSSSQQILLQLLQFRPLLGLVLRLP